MSKTYSLESSEFMMLSMTVAIPPNGGGTGPTMRTLFSFEVFEFMML
jgi:hypothetical protein